MNVSEAHFGVVYPGIPQDPAFMAVLFDIGDHISRWPGRVLYELRPEVFDIGESPVFDPTFRLEEDASRTRLMLSESIEFVRSEESINVLVPTYRYAEDVNAGHAGWWSGK